MEKVAKKRSIFSLVFQWYFIDQPKVILQIWKNLLKFNLNYSSIPLLLRTLFSPWRKIAWSKGRGFDFKRYAEVFLSNAISRGIGAVLRFILIVIGVSLEIIIFFGGVIIFAIWFLLPFLLTGGLVLGIGLMLGVSLF